MPLSGGRFSTSWPGTSKSVPGSLPDEQASIKITRGTPRIWKATSMPPVPPSAHRTPSGRPRSHIRRTSTGPAASSPRSRFPQPITSTFKAYLISLLRNFASSRPVWPS